MSTTKLFGANEPIASVRTRWAAASGSFSATPPYGTPPTRPRPRERRTPRRQSADASRTRSGPNRAIARSAAGAHAARGRSRTSRRLRTSTAPVAAIAAATAPATSSGTTTVSTSASQSAASSTHQTSQARTAPGWRDGSRGDGVAAMRRVTTPARDAPIRRAVRSGRRPHAARARTGERAAPRPRGLGVVHEAIEVARQRRGPDAARLEDRPGARVVVAHAHREVRGVELVRGEHPPRARGGALLDALSQDAVLQPRRQEPGLARREPLGGQVDDLADRRGAVAGDDVDCRPRRLRRLGERVHVVGDVHRRGDLDRRAPQG